MSEAKPLVLTSNILVPIGLVITMIAVAAAGARWLEMRFTASENRTHVEMLELGTRIASLEIQLIELQQTIRGGLAARWTAVDMRLWTERFAERNPELTVPEPKHVPQPGEEL
jgi:hypothetical protein